MGSFAERDAEIIKARLNKESFAKIGDSFGVSRSRVEQIFSRHLQAEASRKRAQQLQDVFKSSDLNKKWSTKLLLEGLAFPWRSTRTLKKYFNKNNIDEFSLKDLIDFILPENKLWPSSKAYNQHGTGMKTYKELVNHLSTRDLGPQIKTEWQTREIKRRRQLEHT